MKKFLFIISVLVFIISLVAFIYRKGNHSINSGTSGQRQLTSIRFSKKVIDVGKKMKNYPVNATYTIYNTGQNLLFISKVEPDCHCTVANYNRDGIKQGDSAQIVLSYDSTRVGVFQSSANVETNSDESPTILLLRGNIIDSGILISK